MSNIDILKCQFVYILITVNVLVLLKFIFKQLGNIVSKSSLTEKVFLNSKSHLDKAYFTSRFDRLESCLERLYVTGGISFDLLKKNLIIFTSFCNLLTLKTGVEYLSHTQCQSQNALNAMSKGQTISFLCFKKYNRSQISRSLYFRHMKEIHLREGKKRKVWVKCDLIPDPKLYMIRTSDQAYF